MIIRVLRDLCQRVHTWTHVSQWVICLKVARIYAYNIQLSIIFVGLRIIDGKDNIISWHAIESR